jgi:O-antigen/teichoic acid export membrane protein
MTLVSKLKKGGGQLAIGQLVTQVASLVRNIVLARLLIPEDFGLATTFILTLTMLEMISSMSVEMLLVQSKQGGKKGYLEAVHGFLLLRGLVVAILIYSTSGIIATIFKTPDLQWAYQILIVVPLIKAFTHMNYKQVQRDYNYKKEMWVETIPQLVTLLLIYPVFLLDASPVLGLWLVVIQSISMVLISHLLADSKYSIYFNIQLIKEVLFFGGPLVLSGFLMFFAIQGDRFLIGYYYSAYEFGVFSVIALLVLNASNALTKFSTSLMLPPLARSRGVKFNRIFNYFTASMIAIALVSGLVLLFLGEWIIALFYGDNYIISGLTGAFALLFAARIMRFPVTVAAISKGITVIPLISNIARLSGVALAFWAAISHASLVYVVLSGAIGEYAAFIVGNILFRRHYISFGLTILWSTMMIIVIGLVYYWGYLSGA